MDSNLMALSNAVESDNSSYDVRILNKYDFVEQAYKGSDGFRDGTYLIKHPKEAFYNIRRRSSFYRNYYKAIIRSMVEPVFSQEITRTTDDPILEEFINDADGTGTPIQEMVKVGCRVARTCGIAFVVMDNTTAEGRATTVSEAVDKRDFPYIYIKYPQDVYEYETDKIGDIETVTFCDGSVKGPDGEKKRYRKWTDTTWEVLESAGDGKLAVVESGIHGVGELPVIPVMDFADTRNLTEFPDPPLYDLAWLSFTIFNIDSQVRTMSQSQTFSTLYGQFNGTKDLTMGPLNFIDIPLDAKMPPGMISPDAAHFNNLMEYADRMTEAMYHLAQQNGVIGVKSTTSGIAKEWDFRAEEAVLKQTATTAQRLERSIYDLLGKYLNREMVCAVSYPEEFSPSFSRDRMMMILNVQDKMPPKPLADALWKCFADEFFGGDEETKTRVMSELDSAIQDQTMSIRNAPSKTLGGMPGSLAGDLGGVA